jgi:diphosphomevalonate decarboxylase
MTNSKSITVKANANFALLKYWGKLERESNIPEMPSISITISSLTSSVEIKHSDLESLYYLNNKIVDRSTKDKWLKVISQFSDQSSDHEKIIINASNDFQTSSGLASSASGIAALTGALAHYFDSKHNLEDLSRVARMGSASAARSIYGGFVELVIQSSGKRLDGYAKQIVNQDYWPLTVLVCITSYKKKKISSTDGMSLSRESSVIYDDWVRFSNAIIDEGREAIIRKDFIKLADLAELSCLFMHAVMMTTMPSLVYWNKKTIECIECIRELRGMGVPVFFTVDAGPHVKVICEPVYTDIVMGALSSIIAEDSILVGTIGRGIVSD